MNIKSKTIYRIENPEDKDGMWYTKDGILRKKNTYIVSKWNC